jgi:hypothetical protein
MNLNNRNYSMKLEKFMLALFLAALVLLLAAPILVLAAYDPLDGSAYSCNELNVMRQLLTPTHYLINDAPMPTDQELAAALKAEQDYLRYCQVRNKS